MEDENVKKSLYQDNVLGHIWESEEEYNQFLALPIEEQARYYRHWAEEVEKSKLEPDYIDTNPHKHIK